jgi:hypothetical protein
MKYFKSTFFILSALILMISCTPSEKKTEEPQDTTAVIDSPQFPGFDALNSDAEAVDLAKEVIKANGGKKAWDTTRYISWNFFNARDLVWDKYTGNVRIDFPARDLTFLININEDTGSVYKGEEPIVNQDSIAKYVDLGKQIWVNDAYWLVMPFKLLDPGVSLSYNGQDTTQLGDSATFISLQFNDVGYTPDNKYRVAIDPETHLVKEWSYFANASDSLPRFTNPWTDYKTYGSIKLSSGRGARKLHNIAVSQQMDSAIFSKK